MTVVLASGSPRRRVLLAFLVGGAQVRVPDVDETLPDLDPMEALQEVARRKALAVVRQIVAEPDGPSRPVAVVAADTAVVRGDRLIGKPADAQQARTMLRRLSAGRHEVVTGVAVWAAGNGAPGEVATGEVASRAVSTRLGFDAIPDTVLAGYVAGGAWKGKAGGYGIQDPELAPFIHIEEGPWSNVVGLPLEATAELLRAAGVACQEPPSEAWLVRHNPF